MAFHVSNMMTLQLASVLAVGLLMGCAGTGVTIPLDLRSSETAAASKRPEQVKVGVLPFEDARSQKRLGVRRHLAGQESFFEVAGGKPGDKIAAVVAEFLRQKGWDAEVVRPDSTAAAGQAVSAESPSNDRDVTLTGKLLDLSANADSKFMRTTIAVTSKMLIQGTNARDGSTIRLTLNGAGSEDVFWFDPEDVQGLLSEVLTESLEKLTADTQVDGKLLRLK